MTTNESIETYLPKLLSSDVDGIAALFGSNPPVINDPREGLLQGRAGIEKLVSSYAKFLLGKPHFVQHMRSTFGSERIISEHVLHVDEFGARRIELPVGILGVRAANGDLSAIHVYYTLWPFKRRHTVRRHFVPVDPKAAHSDVVAEFVKQLGTGDIPKALSLFQTDMYMRESSGPPYVHWGRADLSGYFVGLFANGAPMVQKNTVTDDGRCAVMEFSVVGWAGKKWPEELHQAGLAVYERGEPGFLRAIRIYDDVDF